MPRILIVDDSPLDRTLAARLLKGENGNEILEAENGEAALSLLGSQDCAVIVTDIQMPVMDGLELLDAVTLQHPEIPVILMTAQGSEEMAVTALERGAASYVPKRRLAADLKSTVERVWCLSRDRDTAADLSACLTGVETRYLLNTDLQLLMSAAESLPRGVERFWECAPTTRVQLSVALEEALTNAYYFGNLEIDPALRRSRPDEFFEAAGKRAQDAKYAGRSIEITARYSADQVEFTVTDEGGGFDVAAVLGAHDPSHLSDAAAGRGLRLMHSFMDEVRYNASGNSVTMVRRRDDGRNGVPPE